MSGRKGTEVSCHKIVGGRADGEVLISSDPVCFYLVDPETGRVLEKGHALEGRCIAGKVLVFPGGKGSSVVQADGLYQLTTRGTAPKAMIIQNPDTVLVATAVIMGVPLVDQVDPAFYRSVADGDWVEVDADNSRIVLAGRCPGSSCRPRPNEEPAAAGMPE